MPYNGNIENARPSIRKLHLHVCYLDRSLASHVWPGFQPEIGILGLFGTPDSHQMLNHLGRQLKAYLERNPRLWHFDTYRSVSFPRVSPTCKGAEVGKGFCRSSMSLLRSRGGGPLAKRECRYLNSLRSHHLPPVFSALFCCVDGVHVSRAGDGRTVDFACR